MNAAAKKAQSRRWWLWFALLAGAGWLALFGDKTPNGGAAAVSLPTRPPALEQPVPKPAAQSVANSSVATPPLLETLVDRTQLIAAAPAASAVPPSGAATGAAQRDLFSTRNWNPPSPPAPVVVPPPVAPPLPFAFLGKKFEGEAWEVYLSRGEQTFIVREGQTLESVWRVDKIAPPSMALTYLPLGQGQALMIGESR